MIEEKIRENWSTFLGRIKEDHGRRMAYRFGMPYYHGKIIRFVNTVPHYATNQARFMKRTPKGVKIWLAFYHKPWQIWFGAIRNFQTKLDAPTPPWRD